ncbi:MAG: 50S ribosomal protein L15 [Bacteroidia bacterium]
MSLHQLRPAAGSVKKRKRIGRGEGSGRGGTATKGHKGDKSRSGYFHRPGFEGGQMPIHRRTPKFGFKNPFRIPYALINLERLETFLSKNPEITEVTPDLLRSKGIVKKDLPVKVLGQGSLSKAVTVSAHKFSQSAKEKIEQVGGRAILLT